MEGSIVFWRSTKHCLAEAQKYLCHNLSFLHNRDILQILLLELHTALLRMAQGVWDFMCALESKKIFILEIRYKSYLI